MMEIILFSEADSMYEGVLILCNGQDFPVDPIEKRNAFTVTIQINNVEINSPQKKKERIGISTRSIYVSVL